MSRYRKSLFFLVPDAQGAWIKYKAMEEADVILRKSRHRAVELRQERDVMAAKQNDSAKKIAHLQKLVADTLAAKDRIQAQLIFSRMEEEKLAARVRTLTFCLMPFLCLALGYIAAALFLP